MNAFLKTFGMLGNAVPTTGTYVMNSAARWLAYSFIALENKTLNKVLVYTSAINGTQANISVSLSIYSDSAAGAPNALVAGPQTVTNLAAGWWEWTGFTYALTAGTRYWLVFKNTTGSPTVTYPTFQWVKDLFNTGGIQNNFCKVDSANSGSSWLNPITAIQGYRLEYSDATFSGCPVSNIAIDTSFASYGSNEYGTLFTTPPTGNMDVVGVVVPLRKTGTPSGNVAVRLRYGTSTITSYKYIPGIISSAANNLAAFYFSSINTVIPSTVCRITLFDDAVDSAANYYYTMAATIQNTVQSKALLFNFKKTGTVNGGTSWTETDTSFMPFALILDESSRVSNRPILNSGIVGY